MQWIHGLRACRSLFTFSGFPTLQLGGGHFSSSCNIRRKSPYVNTKIWILIPHKQTNRRDEWSPGGQCSSQDDLAGWFLVICWVEHETSKQINKELQWDFYFCQAVTFSGNVKVTAQRAKHLFLQYVTETSYSWDEQDELDLRVFCTILAMNIKELGTLVMMS